MGRTWMCASCYSFCPVGEMASVITPVISVSDSLFTGQGLGKGWNTDNKAILVSGIWMGLICGM